MRIIPIFVSETKDEGIWSIALTGELESEFDKFFDSINDPQFLFTFFEANEGDLRSGFWREMSLDDAVQLTIEDANTMEDILYEYAEGGFIECGMSLEQLFMPLNNYEYVIAVHQKSKAKLKNSWMRLYGIRLAANCYLITGGAIKLTRNMLRPHLQNELKKLSLAKQFLRDKNIQYSEDLINFNNE
jgi:hypothetical protein